MSKFNLTGAKCMSWVKQTLALLGIIQNPYGGVDAWDFFLGVNNSRLKYFNPALSTTAAKSYDYSNEIADDLAIVWGYFKNSSRVNVSNTAISNKRDNIKIQNLNKFPNYSKGNITPITHVGFSYKGILYDFTNGEIRINPKTSFIPIAYMELDKLIKSKI